MFDTDKYEGCRETAWRCVGQPYTELVDAMMEINRNGPDSCTPADLELWADAPLFLEEIKRLHERHVAFMQWMIEHYAEIVNEWEASE